MMESIVKWSIVAAVGVGGAIIYWSLKNKKPQKQSLMPTVNEDKDKGCLGQNTTFFPKDDFINNVLTFTGTFEPLYNAIHKPDFPLEDKANIYQDWCLRLKTVCNDVVYTRWAENMTHLQITERLELLLQDIVSCGVVRDNRTYLVVDNETACRYIDWKGASLVVGDKLRIASASWSLHDKCIEKGIVIKNNAI